MSNHGFHNTFSMTCIIFHYTTFPTPPGPGPPYPDLGAHPHTPGKVDPHPHTGTHTAEALCAQAQRATRPKPQTPGTLKIEVSDRLCIYREYN